MYMKIVSFNSLVWGSLRLTPMTTFAASRELSLTYGIAFGVFLHFILMMTEAFSWHIRNCSSISS